MANQEILKVQSQISNIILGKDQEIKLALSCLAAGGHLLIEDLPGMGKTTLAQAIGQSLGLGFARVQFTSDLLPADILGVTIFNASSNEQQFTFKKGPIFNHLLLADEINRATPKTQSALLEAMEEGKVSVDGETYTLPEPFVVIATQNPSSQMGTYPLPESQLDRFLMKISLGYPSDESERALIEGQNPREKLSEIQPLVPTDFLLKLFVEVQSIHMTESLIQYIHRLVLKTREWGELSYGLSPRGTMALTRSAQSWALLSGRDHVLPDDVQAVFKSVVEHRIRGREDVSGQSKDYSSRILESVEVVS